MQPFEELWLKSPGDLSGFSSEQISEVRKIARYIFRQVLKDAKKQKAAKKI